MSPDSQQANGDRISINRAAATAGDNFFLHAAGVRLCRLYL
jgi:hypothetical protein